MKTTPHITKLQTVQLMCPNCWEWYKGHSKANQVGLQIEVPEKCQRCGVSNWQKEEIDLSIYKKWKKGGKRG